MNRVLTYLYPFLLLSVTGCKLDLNVPETSPGSADLSRYVAVGGAQTAGFEDGGLYREAQENSFPAILAKQILDAGGGNFVQPLLPEGNGSGYQYLADFTESGIPIVKEKGADPSFPTKVTGDFQNIGIPSMRVKDIGTPNYGSLTNSNPFFYRLLGTDEESKTYLEYASESKPSFFTCWLGMQDVLGYATSGGIYGTSGEPGTGLNGITNPVEFEALYQALIDTLISNGAQGFIMNLPDVLQLPFFNGIPKQVIDITDQDLLDQLNQGYGLFNLLVMFWNQDHPNDQYDEITWQMGPNYPVVYDESVPAYLLHRRRLKPDEFLLLSLPFDSLQPISAGGQGWGTQNPIPLRYTLFEDEVKNVNDALDAYNQIIEQIASKNPNVTLLDMKAYYKIFQPQLVNDGETISFDFITGGLFSIDGLHLTPKGNAFVANRIIEMLNKQYSASISPVLPSQYRGVLFP